MTAPLQDLSRDETALLDPAPAFKRTRVESSGVYGLQGRCFVLEPEDGRTRPIARGRTPRGLASLASPPLLELLHSVIERRRRGER